METLIGFQHWLYGGIAEGIGSVAGGDYRVVWVAMATATLFGAVHALMPGHGKLVLISYHLGQPSSPTAVPSQSSWADALKAFVLHLFQTTSGISAVTSRLYRFGYIATSAPM